jgi:hypothetical protein
VSAVGVMFAPNQEKAASELLRVCRAGGKIGLTCWTPGSAVAQMSAALAKHLPPPPAGMKPPVAWGFEPRLRELFGASAATMHVTYRRHLFKHASPAAYVEHVKQSYGPTTAMFRMFDEAKRRDVTEELTALVASANASGDATLLVPAEYAEIVVTKSAG